MWEKPAVTERFVIWVTGRDGNRRGKLKLESHEGEVKREGKGGRYEEGPRTGKM